MYKEDMVRILKEVNRIIYSHENESLPTTLSYGDESVYIEPDGNDIMIRLKGVM